MVIHLYHLQVDHAPGFNCSEIAKQVALQMQAIYHLQEVTISQNHAASIHVCFVFFGGFCFFYKVEQKEC